MATDIIEPGMHAALKDPALKQQLQQLRQVDAWTNWLYIARAWLFLAVVIGSTIGFYYLQVDQGWSWWLNVPVTVVAIICVGAGQHQLTGLGHEASHHTLLKNRLANDLVSDWLCMFPLFSSTYHYRLQHLAHHQFVNDPVRDPDVRQLAESGHWLSFPLAKRAFLTELAKQLWIPRLFRYIRIRAKHGAMPSADNPYRHRAWRPSKLASRVGVGYILGLFVLLPLLVWADNLVLLAIVPGAAWVGIVSFYLLLPERLYQRNRIHPVIPTRWTTAGRMTFATLLFGGTAWASALWDRHAAWYLALLWLLPLVTSFSFFMILRQLVQHGNGGRGWLTNTRIFFVNWIIDFCVFPIGQGKHLPHHLFATVPHYRLGQLHSLLLRYPEYAAQATEVHGYFISPEQPQVHPTVLDVLGPEHAPPGDLPAHFDHSVLEGEKVEELHEILGG